MNAYAYDWSLASAHVTLVEATYMPYTVSFQLDKGAGGCPAGSWFFLAWSRGYHSRSTEQRQGGVGIINDS